MIKELTNKYEYFLVDIWGVLHDGVRAYPESINVLRQLKKAGAKITLLSNAPRRAKKVQLVLRNLGFLDDMYDNIITSGEAAYHYLTAEKKYNYFYLGPDKDLDLLEEIAVSNRVYDLQDADVILLTGFINDDSKLGVEREIMKNALKNNVPMICVNPDIYVVRQHGEEILCAGYIAQKYTQMGGEVEYFGKPYSYVYKMALKKMKMEPEEKDKVLAIGDGPMTDIFGANKEKIDSMLITGGVLSKEMRLLRLDNDEQIKELVRQKYNVMPDYVADSFKW